MSRKNSIQGLSELEKAGFLDIFYIYEHFKFHAQLQQEKGFITLGPGTVKTSGPSCSKHR